MGAVTGVIRAIDTANKYVGKFAGWIGFLMVAIVTTDVILRYMFNITFVFVQELEWYLFGIMFLSGAGYTLYLDGHVRVDVFYQRASKKTRAWINLIGVIFFLLPGCYLVIDTSWNFFTMAYSIQEGSPDPGGIPWRWALKFFIPFGFFMVALQGVSMGLKNLLFLLGRPYTECPEHLDDALQFDEEDPSCAIDDPAENQEEGGK